MIHERDFGTTKVLSGYTRPEVAGVLHALAKTVIMEDHPFVPPGWAINEVTPAGKWVIQGVVHTKVPTGEAHVNIVFGWPDKAAIFANRLQELILGASLSGTSQA